MQLHMLLQSNMKPVPPTIKEVANWGEIFVRLNDGSASFSGEHVLLEGKKTDFENWLRPFDGFLVGQGPPQFQNFEVRHITTGGSL